MSVAFEVLDALGGLCRLVRRDGTLDGSVPLRVVQGCVPFLEGNAFGWQVTLTRELTLEKRLGGWSLTVPPSHREAIEAARRGGLPRLRAQGFVGAAWARALEQGLGWSEGGLLGGRFALWTGLLVRPVEGLWLRVSGNANRRNLRFGMDPLYIDDPGAFTPLVLTMRPVGSGAIHLSGELATVAPVAPRASFERVGLASAPALGEAHGDFFDQEYFAAKKGEITRKYRKLINHQPRTEEAGPAVAQLVDAGPGEHAVSDVGPFVGPGGPQPSPRPTAGGTLQEIIFTNTIPFRVTFDGHTVKIDPDRDALAAGAREVERRFAEALGASFQQEHRGALWYLTKYFTPHPAGEAHFFVKPWSFVKTPPGWSCLLDGEHGAGYDVLRGVVSTDQFHATPSVFWLHQPGATIEIARGTPLLRVLPIPRGLLTATFGEKTFLDGR